jgi:ribosomal protein L7/L12
MENVKLINQCIDKRNGGASAESVVEFLRGEGLTIVESIKIVREVFRVSLGDAKAIVTNNESWRSEVRAADQLHDELLRNIQSDNGNSEK